MKLIGLCWPGLRPFLWPLLAVLGRCWGLSWRSWAVLGAHVGGLGPLLGSMLAVLGRSWGLYGRSRAEKCEEHGYVENMFISRTGARSAAWGSVLSRSWGLCCRSQAALGSYVGGLVPLLGPTLAGLGRSWSLCWRSWAALGAYVGGLGPKHVKNRIPLKCVFRAGVRSAAWGRS